MAEANKEHLQRQDTIKESMKVEEQVMKIAFDRIMEDRRRLTGELRSISEKAGREAAKVIPQKQEDVRGTDGNRALAEQASGRSLASSYQQYEIAERRKLAAAEKLQAGRAGRGGRETGGGRLETGRGVPAAADHHRRADGRRRQAQGRQRQSVGDRQPPPPRWTPRPMPSGSSRRRPTPACTRPKSTTWFSKSSAARSKRS